MIKKVSLEGFKSVKPNFGQDTFCKPKKQRQIRNDSEVMSKELAQASKAIAFCGGSKINVSGEKLGIVLNDFIDSDDVITLNDSDSKSKYVFQKTDKGFEVTKEVKKDDKVENGQVFRAEFSDVNDLPNITFKMGKYKPEITIHDDSLDGGRIQMFEGSEIKGDKFTLTMPGKYKDYATNKEISFGGRTLITTLNKEDKTKEAVDKYFNSGLAAQKADGDYADFMKAQDPTIAIPAGGFGTRFENMTEEDGENKPSFRLPTDDNYRIIAGSLNMGAMAGLIGGENDSLIYASQAEAGTPGAIEEAENVKKVGQFKTDGGAIYEALEKGFIPKDKDLVVLNADIITNADITRAYHALKTLPDAALVIPYYPVDAKRAQSFGLMGLEEDESGNKIIKEFIEKPPHTNIEPLPTDFKTTDKYKTFDEVHEIWEKVNKYAKMPDGEHYYGNPGVYVMSKEAADVLRKMGVENPKNTGLGASVMPEIVRLCQNGDITDKNGKPLKAYTLPLERKGGTPAFWDDIGSAEAYMNTIKDMAYETSSTGSVGQDNFFYGIPGFVLNDFKKNFDQETCVLYMSDKAKEIAKAFSEKFGAEIKGNVFIADKV